MSLSFYQSVDLFLFCPLSRNENKFFLCGPPLGRKPDPPACKPYGLEAGPKVASRAKPRNGGISARLQCAVMFNHAPTRIADLGLSRCGGKV